MIKTQYSRLLILLVVCLTAGSSVVNAQTRSENVCSNSKRAKFTVECKDRYYLGETATITLSNNNTGRTLMTVKEFEHQKFTLEVTGVFSNDRVVEKKKIDYQGSFYIPPAMDTGRVNLWYAPVLLPAKYVTLRPGESTTMTWDLSKSFSPSLGVGQYKLVFKSQDGHKVVKEFEVYFDNEKTLPLMVKQLESEDLTERNRAVYNLSQFNRPAFIASLQALEKTGNEKQREYASSILAEIKLGNFNPLDLLLITPTRYSRSTNPTVTISIRNRSQSPEPVKEPQRQKFFLELRKLAYPGERGEYIEDTKRCVYTPKEAQHTAGLITLGPSESTSFTLNLQECFGARLEAGHYQLIVKSDREEQIKEQTVEQTFELRGH